jgi:hypothetical protein
MWGRYGTNSIHQPRDRPRIPTQLPTCHQQVIFCARTGDVEQVAFGVIDFLQIGVVAYCLDALLQGNDLIVAGHHLHDAKLKTLGEVHGADQGDRLQSPQALPFDTPGTRTPDSKLRQVTGTAPSHMNRLRQRPRYSQPPVNPARRSPVTTGGQRRMRSQIRPVRWFSIISTTGPWSMPNW